MYIFVLHQFSKGFGEWDYENICFQDSFDALTRGRIKMTFVLSSKKVTEQ